jgi:putative holliday junction resolvase
MERRPRVAAVDYGTRRVGLAVSDPFGLFAQPVGTFAPDDAVNVLKGLVEDREVATVLVGWPLLEDGSEGEAVDRVRPYLARLRNALPDVSIERWDERYSTRRAMESLVEAGVPRGARRQKGRLDQAAAATILQEYLDEQAGR